VSCVTHGATQTHSRCARPIEASSLTNFCDFGLAEPITRALAEEKYVTPTQSRCRPSGRSVTPRRDRDRPDRHRQDRGVCATDPAHLFTNKRRPERKTCRVLVLSPTRELSGQILDSFETYGRHLHLTAALTIGGVGMGKQVAGTARRRRHPCCDSSRLLDRVARQRIALRRKPRILVLIKPDRMLDMGFIIDSGRSSRSSHRAGKRCCFPRPCRAPLADLAKSDGLRRGQVGA